MEDCKKEPGLKSAMILNMCNQSLSEDTAL